MDKVPLGVPGADGVNFTVIVELLFDARRAGGAIVGLAIAACGGDARKRERAQTSIGKPHRLAGARRAHCEIGPAVPVEVCHPDRNRCFP